MDNWEGNGKVKEEEMICEKVEKIGFWPQKICL
jgi:hypothetical protein